MNSTEQIFETIKKQLDEGTVPWHKPWVSQPSRIINHYNGQPYRSVRNRMLLGCAGEYATIRQINSEGGRVNKGAKGYRIYFGNYVERKKNDSDEKDVYYLLRAFTVFHISDTNLQPKYADIWNSPPPVRCDASDVLDDYAKRTGLQVRFGGDSAHFSESHNYIIVPQEHDFQTPEKFWGTVFHELVHSTMRLTDRNYPYAKEELVAEIGSVLCVGQLGMTPAIDNSVSYINFWKSRIRDFKPIDFSDACRSAEWAFNTIFNITNNNGEQNNG